MDRLHHTVTQWLRTGTHRSDPPKTQHLIYNASRNRRVTPAEQKLKMADIKNNKYKIKNSGVIQGCLGVGVWGLSLLWRHTIKTVCVEHEKLRARDRSVQMVTQWVLWLLALWDCFLFGEGSDGFLCSFIYIYIFFKFHLSLALGSLFELNNCS